MVPAVIIGKACRDLPVPIVGESHLLKLLSHVIDAAQCPRLGMALIFYRGVLSGLAERVVSHRMQDVISLHYLYARCDIAYRVITHVAHVDAARRVREHLEEIILFPGGIFLYFEGALRLPFLLPFLFYALEIVQSNPSASS